MQKPLLLFLTYFLLHIAYAQSPAVQSAAINFGTSTCGNNSSVSFASIGNPGTNPYLISDCNLSAVFPDVFNKFIAYNPKDNKIYINDISHGDSRVYIYDMGLPNNYMCPATLPSTPSYEYSYVPNNWEFDSSGNVWCIKGLSGSTATIERIDETTGTILTTKTLNFPADNVPNTLYSGDIVIIPNGRLFIAMGDSPTKFYEVTNYASGSGNATATFIQNMPRPCYGVLYFNGKIELTGTDFSSNCYKYVFDIPSKVMGAEQPFQLGMSPVDNSSISPAIGISKEMTGSTFVDDHTADIIYDVYARNMGNVRLNNFNIIDDLGAVFGAANVSHVSVTMDASTNPGNLLLNPNFDGINNTKIFNDNQVLSNLTNGMVGITIRLRATNLIADKTYYNSAKSIGEIGEGGIKVSVVDSSNNGPRGAIDPNSDGDAGDNAENVPTPYFFGFVLPVHFVSITAENYKENQNTINWVIGATQVPVSKFDVEYSEDCIKWQPAGTVQGHTNQVNYFMDHITYSDKNLYYKVKATLSTGQTYYSKQILVRTKNDKKTVILPNPADDAITVNSPGNDYNTGRKIYIVNALGKEVFEHSFPGKNIYIHTSSYPDGYYVVSILDNGNLSSYKILIRHQ